MSRIVKKFIGDNQVDGSKIRLENNQTLRGRNAGDTADVDILKINLSDAIEMLAALNMGTFQIKNMADGTDPQDAATLSQVEALVAGLTDPKDAARAATTGALPASTYDNGTAGVGATLTGDVNGALPVIDGISLAVGDRLLVKDQVAGLENGLYEVTQVGDGSNPFILTRTTDADEDDEVTQGMFVPVAEGTVNGSLGFLLTTPDPITVGTSALSFAQFGEVIQAGFGLTKSGTTLSVDIGLGLEADGNQFRVDTDDDTFGLIDGTTKILGNEVVGRRRFEEGFTLSAGDISNGYVDLAKVASRDSVILFPRDGIRQKIGVDFSVSYTGGASGKTRVTWIGDYAGIVAEGDNIDLNYESLDY